MVPTVLEALGIEAPTSIKGVTQSPIEGHSFAHAFKDATAPSKHVTQYFEMFGHRSIYHDGWRAVCPWPGTSFKEAGAFFGAPIDKNKLTELDAKGWELYHVEKDFAENHNLAAENRPKLIEMIAMWYVEAGKYNVLPIDSRGTLRFADPRPQLAAERKSYTYYPGTQMVPINSGPTVLNRPHSLTAEVEIPKGGAEGVLVSAGDVQGGFSFYVQNGKLHYVYNYVGSQFFHVESTRWSRRDGTRCASSSRSPASPTSRAARARQARASSTSTRSWSVRSTSRSPCRCPSASAVASSAAPTPDRRSGTSTSHRSSSPVRSTP